MRNPPRLRVQFVAANLAAIMMLSPLAYGQSLPSCPQTTAPSLWTGATMQSIPTKSGVTYDTGGATLKLDRAAGKFTSAALGITDTFVYATTGDFDKDGWDDFVGVGENTSFVRVYRNRTFDNPAPDWTDATAVRTPKFTMVRELVSASSVMKRRPTIAADFNGDTWPDILRIEAVAEARADVVTMWLNQASNDGSGNPRFLGSYTPLASGTAVSKFGYQNWGGGSIQAYDYNSDRKLDLLVGSGENNGEIRVFLNVCPTAGAQPAAPALLKCSANPTFSYSSVLITNLGTGTNVSGGLPVFAYGKMNADAYPDLVVGAPNLSATASNRLRYYPGQSGGTLFLAGVKTLTNVGGVTGVMAADFSQDGRVDIISTNDNWHYGSNVVGGISDYYVNSGTDTPFAAPTQRLTNHNAPTFDYDVGFVFNYDHDPNNTLDVMVADGNHTTSFYVLANRIVDQYVPCGEAASGIMDIGTLASSEMVVTGARIHPTAVLNSGTISYYLSNEEPPNWVLATSCGDSTGDLCATFPKGSGRDVRWKAVMCSNAARTKTPSLSAITAKFSYTEATEHYRSGVVVNDGISYVGAFREPGDRGKFYAINANLDTKYWEAAAKLDALADSSRNIYTAHKDTGERLEFDHSGGSVDVGLLATMGAADADQAADVIDWVRSARFGVGNAGIPLSKLGAIETSTPAVLTKPGLPTWYVFATSAERTKVDQFLQAQADRFNIVLFGSRDGMVHALHSRPTDITNTKNGQEAWAFVPPETAAGMVEDYSASLSSVLQIGSYPDGSPTLADVADVDGNMTTLAIVAGGNGGKSIAALDVTETIDSETEAIIGPTPLWSSIPGGSNAGQAFSKVAVARTEIDDEIRYVAVAGSGVDFDDLTAPYEKGREVVGFDALTGDLLWKFQTKCPVTSDITVFETDDELEPGSPAIDGKMDRAVFADRCGYVYKVEPGKDLAGGWNDNSGLGGIEVDEVDGVQLYALFSTLDTEAALAAESPIAGTLGAQIEASTSRLVLFFGTGGVESHSPIAANEFYAVYADDGSVRSKLAGSCDGGTCEKFYGGVVVSKEQVMFTKTRDPAVGSTTCDRGSSVVQAVQLNNTENGEFVTDFTTAVSSAVMGSLYGDAGALYFASLDGDIVRIGEPRAPDAGGDSNATGSGTGTGTGTGTMDPNAPMTLMGWRQVF